jgi:type II secretion system (T2SS) protein K
MTLQRTPGLRARARPVCAPCKGAPAPSAPSQGANQRRGFALLAVLWVLTALSVLSGVALAVARTGSQATRNRILLARAGWAREACVEILLAHWASPSSPLSGSSPPDPLSAMRRGGTAGRIGPTDLGRGTWCTARLEDPAAKLNVNLADREALLTTLSAVSRQPSVDSLVDALLDWRDPDNIARTYGLETPANRNGPLADVAELRYVRGFDSTLVTRLSALLTTRGTGVINVNAAPREVLATLPGMSEEAIVVLLGRRAVDHPMQSTDELAASLSKGARAQLFASYPEFVRAATFAPTQLMAVVEGGVKGTPIVARATLTLVPVPDRLAVIRRETE